MKTAKDRRLRRTERRTARAPEIDTSGMSPSDQVLHALKRYKLAELIKGIEPSEIGKPLPGTADATPAAVAATVEPRPPPVEVPAPPPEPVRLLSWSEEHVSWGNRLPEPEGGGRYGWALTEYDCLKDEWDDELDE